jgi:hypothetical protein
MLSPASKGKKYQNCCPASPQVWQGSDKQWKTYKWQSQVNSAILVGRPRFNFLQSEISFCSPLCPNELWVASMLLSNVYYRLLQWW